MINRKIIFCKKIYIFSILNFSSYKSKYNTLNIISPAKIRFFKFAYNTFINLINLIFIYK